MHRRHRRLGHRSQLRRVRTLSPNGATSILYEGAPQYPEKDRTWEIIERYGVTILYTAPTAIRTFMKWGDQLPKSRGPVRCLRLLGSVGEPINPEAWIWYHEVIGDGRCPIVDTWWQTETGGMMISPLPGSHEHKARLGDVFPYLGSGLMSSTTRAEACALGKWWVPRADPPSFA